jgi:hypothetical protein
MRKQAAKWFATQRAAAAERRERYAAEHGAAHHVEMRFNWDVQFADW